MHRGGFIHHSDRGSQPRFNRSSQAGVEPSVGSVGDSYDNALAGTIDGLYKAEVVWRRGPWRNFEAVEFATMEWVDWFNKRRLLEPIGNIPSAEAEERYYASPSRTPSPHEPPNDNMFVGGPRGDGVGVREGADLSDECSNPSIS